MAIGADEETSATGKEVDELETALSAKTEAEKEAEDKAVEEAAKTAEGGQDVDGKSAETEEDEHPGAHDDDTLTAEQKRERNRKWREDRKARQREREESYQRKIQAQEAQLAELHGRLAVIERRSTGTELAALDAHIKDTAGEYQHYKEQIAIQSEAGNHAGVAEAVEKMNFAQRKFEQLNAAKQGYQRNQQQAPALDPRLVNYAQAWMKENAWYNPSGADPDSMRAMTEDKILAAEGWNPSTSEFWAELTRRVAKVLPHRAKTGYNEAAGGKSSRPGASVAGSGGGASAGGVPKGSFKLSEERVKAIKEAGAWEDPKERARMIDNYKRYDQDHATV